MNSQWVSRFLKFGLVGAIGFVVDFGVTALLRDGLHVQEFVANTVGFSVAATSNYLLNRWWTWRSHSRQVLREYLKYIVVSVVGLGINTAVIYLWMALTPEVLHLGGLSIAHFWIGKVLATGVVMVWNFLANHFYTFRSTGKG